MKAGDRVVITHVVGRDNRYIAVGDKATLIRQDSKGDWWADFDTRHWGEHHKGMEADHRFCIETGFATCKLLSDLWFPRMKRAIIKWWSPHYYA